jgi:sec-independent protein translocase protein TatB
MFDIGWSELVVIAVVALIAIGPKELPGVLRMVGQWMGKARKMAGEFQGQFQEAMREAEMADLKKTFDEVKETATGFASNNVMTSLQKDVSESLRIDDLSKTETDSQVASVTDAPSTSTTSATSQSDAPEPPTPQSFVEAEAHPMPEQLGMREVPVQPAPQDITPSAPEVLKDAKAS